MSALGRPASVCEAGPELADEWNDFVSGHPDGTVSHRLEWRRVVEEAYQLETRYLVARGGERWLGVFPVVLMPGLPWRSGRGVSVAFTSYGDALAAEGVSACAVRDCCLGHLEEEGIHRVEVRRLCPAAPAEREVTLLLELPADPDELWSGLRDKVRNQVRKAMRSELTVQVGSEQTEDLHRIYSSNMRRLGTPVHSEGFFRAIVSSFGDDARILTVRAGNRPIAAMLVLCHGYAWSNPFASSLWEYNALNPNMLLYWEVLRLACISGARRFDFGRSLVNSGTFRFKAQWGARPVALSYETYVGGEMRPQSSSDLYRGRAARLLGAVWRCLPPSLHNALGPVVRRRIP